MRVYSQALTAAEASALYTASIPPPDSTDPLVSITAPTPGATVSGTIQVEANASDNVGVVGVQFFVDSTAIGSEDTSAPYATSWTTTTAGNGDHTLTARARDAAGNETTSSSVVVNVDNVGPPSDPIYPTVSITAPLDGAEVNGTIQIEANADDNVGVVGVQFLVDGNNLGSEDTTAPYSTSWNTGTTGNGPHTLTARARDAAGNVTDSAGIDVTVNTLLPPPIGYWRFDEASGTSAADASGNNRTATLVNGASFALGGMTGNAVMLDGVNDYVNLGTLGLSANATLSMWMRATATSGDRRLLGQLTGGTTQAGALAIAPNGAAAGSLWVWDGGSWRQLAPGNSIPINTWVHLTVTFAGGTATAYVNGAAVGGQSSAFSFAAANAGLGGKFLNQYGNPFVGLLDDVRVYSQALTAAEAIELYNTSNPSPDSTFPQVSVTAPTAGATVSATIQVEASASDNVGVVGVQFLVDGTAIGSEDTSAPYATSWTTTTTGNGDRTLTARARDAAGNVTTSSPVVVTVDNVTTVLPQPIGYWRFDEASGTSAADASGNNRTATLVNGASFALGGMTGNAVKMDGVNDYVNLGMLGLSGNGTLSMWMRAGANSGDRRLLSQLAGGATQAGALAIAPNGAAAGSLWVWDGGSWRQLAPGNTIPLNTWVHLTVTFAGGTATAYVNGAAVGSQSSAFSFAAANAGLGGRFLNQWGNTFVGLLDDVRVYSQALTGSQVQTLYNSN